MDRRMLAAVASVIFALGCQAPPSASDSSGGGAKGGGKEDNSDAKPLPILSAFAWADSSYEDFGRASQAPRFTVDPPQPESDPLTVRLQAWADAVHDGISRKVGDMPAPRPRIRVVASKTANAWVSGVLACIAGPVALGGDAAPGTGSEADLAVISNGQISTPQGYFGQPRLQCLKPTNWAGKGDPVEWFNSLGSPCRVERHDDGSYAISGSGCQRQLDVTATRARQLAIYVTGTYVHVTSPMVEAAAHEEALVSVLVHELGHYYRSHAVRDLLTKHFDYWYELVIPPIADTPLPVGDSDQLNGTFNRLMPTPMGHVQGQYYSYELTDFLIDKIPGLLANVVGDDCARTRTDAEGRWTGEFFSARMGSPISNDAAQQYLAFEQDLRACAATVQVGDDAGAIPWNDFVAAVRQQAPSLADPLPAAGTLGDLLDELNRRGHAWEADIDAFLGTLRDRHLGRYTAEQEADEFSTVWFAGIGLDPQLRVTSEIDLIRPLGENDPARFLFRNGIDFQTCLDLYQNGWKTTDATGTHDSPPPIGSLWEPHHGDCFRLFVVSEEIVAHHLQAAAVTPPSFPQPWSDMLAKAHDLTANFWDHPSGGFGLLEQQLGPSDLEVLQQGTPLVDGL